VWLGSLSSPTGSLHSSQSTPGNSNVLEQNARCVAVRHVMGLSRTCGK